MFQKNCSIKLEGFLIPIVFLFLLNFCGCGTQNGSIDNPNFEFKAKNQGDFYVFQNNENKTSSLHYFFSGSIRNKTDHLFEFTSVEMAVRCFFENGNELQQKSAAENLIFGFGNNDVSSSSRNTNKLNTKDTLSLNQMISPSLPLDKLDYPIKKVVLEFRVYAQDPINRVNINQIIADYDITDKWKIALQKIKDGKADFSQKELNTRTKNLLKKLGY